MKVLLLFSIAFVAFTFGKPTLKRDVQVYEPKKLGLKITDIASTEVLNQLVEALKKFAQDGDVSGIFDLDMNPLTDELLLELGQLIIESGLDPLSLDDETLELLGILGSIKLTNGWLQDISTISRNDDIVQSYNSATKTITFSLPLQFSVLLFTYSYKTRALALVLTGDVQGKIQDVHLNLAFTYNAESGFALDSIDMKDSGSERKYFEKNGFNMLYFRKVTVKFTGNGLLDVITNAMTSVVTTVLHPLIVAILEANVKSVGNEIVAAINEYLDNNM